MILSYVYLDIYIEKNISILIFGITGICFTILAFMDRSRSGRKKQYQSGRKGISEILLLGEGGNATAVWDIYGKTSIVFGKDEKQTRTVILPGDSNGMVYLNENAVFTPSPPTEFDVIELGESKFVFIPFCGEHFKWTE